MGKIILVLLLLFTSSVQAESGPFIRIPLHASKISLDPSTVQDFSSFWVSRQVNCQLVRMKSGVLMLEAAKSIYYQSPTDIEIQLNSGIRFSDGSPLTSDDVIASFNYLKNKRIVLRNIFTWIKEIKQNGRDGLSIVLKRPIPQLFKVLSAPNYSIFKKDFLAKASQNPTLWSMPIGCGNYRVESVTASSIALKPIREGLPIRFILLPDSQVSADEITQYDIISLDVIGQANKLKDYKLLNVFDPYQYYYIVNTRIAPWNNKEERCRLLAKLNPENIIKSYGNEARPANDYLPSGTLGYDHNARFITATQEKYKNFPLLYKASFCVSYLQSSIEEVHRNTYLNLFRNLYPNVIMNLINKSVNIANKFAEAQCDGMFVAFKSNCLDAYEYLLLFSEKGINISGYQNRNLTNQIENSQQIEDATRRVHAYRSIIENIKNLCVIYPLFTRPYETVYVRKNIETPDIGKGDMNDYYLGKVAIHQA